MNPFWTSSTNFWELHPSGQQRNDHSQCLQYRRVLLGRTENTRETVDIKKPNAEIARIVTRQTELRQAIDEIVANLEGA